MLPNATLPRRALVAVGVLTLVVGCDASRLPTAAERAEETSPRATGPAAAAAAAPMIALNRTGVDTIAVGDTVRYTAAGTLVTPTTAMTWRPVDNKTTVKVLPGRTSFGATVGTVIGLAPGATYVMAMPEVKPWPTATIRVVVVASRSQTTTTAPSAPTAAPIAPTDPIAPTAPTAAPAPTAPAPAPAPAPTPTPTPTPVAPTPAPAPPPAPTSVVLPALPQSIVDVRMPARTGRLIAVAAGGDLQAALNAAAPGDVVELAPGATFTGNFTLPAKVGMTATSTNWIVVRAGAGAPVPAQGTRLDGRAVAGRLPRIVTPNSAPALATAIGAAGWRLVGLEVTVAPAASLTYHLVRFGDGQATALAQLPARLVLDRVWVHGHPTLHVQRCVQLNAGAAAVVDSYLSDCHTKGQEGHVIGGWSGTGPWRVENNYIEGGTIGMLVGGADPKIVGLVPSDIEVRGNHFVKPLAWKGVWSAKNAFELKNAKRVLLEGNVFENNWVDAQNGFILLFQALNQDNTAPWTTVQDVTIRYNVMRNAPGGVNILSRVAYPYGGRPAQLPTQPSQRFLIAHNVFDNVGAAGTGNGRLFQLSGDMEDVTIAHNTGATTHSALYLAGLPMKRLVVTDNLFARGSYGVYGDATGEGTVAMTKFAPDGVFRGNVLFGTTGAVTASRYPTGNTYPATILAAGISSATLGSLGTISIGTVSTGAGTTTDGRAAGADVAAVTAATARAKQ